MTSQIHKRFTDDQVRSLFEKYVTGEIKSKTMMEILQIGKTRFFALLKKYRKSADEFKIQHAGSGSNNRIDSVLEQTIIKN